MHLTFHGLLVLDKPLGITSRDAVDHALGWFPRGTRLGHTGTLDPLATGALVLCVGSATRLTEYVQRMDKVYETSIRLGVRSTTDDAEGEMVTVPVKSPPTLERVTDLLREFIGEHEQVPPDFSAAKIAGRRAYDLARQGQEVTLAPRRVRIDRIDIQEYRFPLLRLEIACGKGTYIRSVARDLGERLGCGGLVETLRRTRVGRFTVAQAVSWEADAATVQSLLQPLATAVADLPRLDLDAEQVRKLRLGQAVAVSAGEPPEEGAVFAEQEGFVGLVKGDRGMIRPFRMMAV